jgi:hypothetical protein
LEVADAGVDVFGVEAVVLEAVEFTTTTECQ